MEKTLQQNKTQLRFIRNKNIVIGQNGRTLIEQVKPLHYKLLPFSEAFHFGKAVKSNNNYSTARQKSRNGSLLKLDTAFPNAQHC